MHLAVFGATFDPPHNGHLALCLLARELLDIDRLLISVSNNPLKQNRSSSDAHRLRMAELLSQQINRTGICSEVSGWELEKKQPSYTVDLMRYLHGLYPADKLTLLVGEDSFREFSLWKECDQLFSLCDIVVFQRATMEHERGLSDAVQPKESVRFINFDCPVSSTAVRALVAAGLSISEVVPDSVGQYIHEQGLYRSPDDSATSIQAQKHQEF